MVTTRMLKISEARPNKRIISKAAHIIRYGGTVIFPTETVYGLGANAFDESAVLKIFKAKSRPKDNPLIVHIADVGWLSRVVEEIPERFEPIFESVWPGPITFVMRKSKSIPDCVTAGLNKVSVRIPSNRIALSLIKASGVPIAAPSANMATRPSPTKAQHIMEEMKGKVDMILDGGQSAYGIESTIVDITSKVPTVLRPGPFTIDELRKILGNVHYQKQNRSTGKPTAPGMKYKHYSPSKPLFLVEKSSMKKIIDFCVKEKIGVVAICSKETSMEINYKNAIILGSESDMYQIARNLFDSFRKLDISDAEVGLIQSFEENGVGAAVMNRINKATGFSKVDETDSFLSLFTKRRK